jgi:peptide/nickel transport system substrate-binding protein
VFHFADPKGARKSSLLVWMRIACLSALLSACARGPVPSANDSSVLRVDIESSPLSLDPRFATDAISSRIDELIFNSLVQIDQHQNYKGDLAESIEWQSRTSIVFHLRPALKFSDGRPLTARDVKFTYDSVMDPSTRSPKAAGFAQLTSIEAPDERTIVFRLKQPYAAAFEMAMLGIVPYGSRASGALPAEIVGSGPFKLISFARDEAVILNRNPWRSTPAHSAREIYFKIVPDPTVQALELAKGNADFSENYIQTDVLNYLRTRGHLLVWQSPGSTYVYTAFNFRDPRLRDLRVRQAIAMAIDRKAIIGSILCGTARPATGMLPPESWAYDPSVALSPYDPVAARRLLDVAGLVSHEGKPRLSIVYKTTPEGRRLGEVLQAMLAAIGIRLEIRTNEFATFYSDIQRGNFDLGSFRWIGINDPNHYFMIFDSKMTPPPGLNRGAYSNPRMDQLVEAGQMTLDREKRHEIYAAVQQLAAADLPYVSLWWLDNVAVMNARIHGFEPYPNGSLRSLANVQLLPASK